MENGSEVCENLKFDGIDAYVIGDVNQERDAHRAKLSAEHPGQRHDEDDVAAQGDHQRLRALAQTLQRAGRGGGDGGDHKAQADDPQSNFSGFHRLRGRGKEPHERL